VPERGCAERQPQDEPDFSFCILPLPSQKGIAFECLHAHQATVFASLISTCFGSRPVPLCDPSQNGWLLERPHAHHQYVPGSTF